MRLKYNREEQVKYISHLDFMRTFQRAIRRAEIPIAYSQGFNPHPMMSFGLPLSVGVTSDAEYMDIELEKDMDPKQLKEKLNQALPEGITILKAVELEKQSSKVAGMIALADYRVIVDLKRELGIHLEEKINDVLKMDEMMIEKEGKKGIKMVNIRSDIFQLTIEEERQDQVVLSMRLSAGSSSNLKPELVLEALKKYIEGFEVDYATVHRIRIMDENGAEI
ncbi:TIGR03936 family radical SAM-associated protein [Petroclostridium sp. X23]|uniref:TIGR03936 family radical SAM-associated protein n=1 Tax=Petroclostridium sp. X23 TaxID=3045146 RepID=UPI0024AD1B91|nr:TIGR03936 family radical SAM-associated protein [Petroclostridium sp. X23]WHH61753.1 TIGR03936 family radical SAM-associated protein [Petroclostridium sp. X23]